MKRILTPIAIVALLIASCDRQIAPPTVVVPIPPQVTISTATPPPTDTLPAPTDTATFTATFIPTDTESPTETPLPTSTDTPVPTATNTQPPRPTEPVQAAPTQPPPTAVSQQQVQLGAIIPDVQGCAVRFDLDGKLYGHAYVDKPVANDNGQMRVQYFVNGATTTQLFPVQQILNLGPFNDGDVVGDNSDSWPCTVPTPEPAGPGCYCVMVPTANGFNNNIKGSDHVKVCYDSSGSVVPGCGLFAFCFRNSGRY